MSTASKNLSKGDTVSWRWGRGTAEGKVTQVHKSDIEATLKGAHITRHASPEKPAYTIKQKDGDKVLKSASEVRKT